eukprot:gnl/MRDRNA2_/MRDRNA2_108745_c0_seq1.p1 gnl/MRDRNA2_/MRDRNA2_108745_c0~~gnl/MRDRNA2_/MRDRNA2_108745_c0_seq1.p1  ORF type:complete len:425 (-),score=126.06 gnl/MRDRNA2_/MRDRNA2_108745_c0_seq1:17-1291(-)
MREQEGSEPLLEPLVPNLANERAPGVSEDERSPPKEKLPVLPRKQPVRMLGQTMPHGARSARLHHEVQPMHPKEEEIVRAIYQKHAHAFFDEMKEAFAKESSQLRRQALKQISKSTAQVASAQSVEDGPAASEVQAELERLRQDVEALREASGQTSGNSLRSLGEKVEKHQNDLKAISKHLKAESAAVKKATLTPVWKERTLQEIAHGELRSVCEEQVSKVFDEFRGEFVKKYVVPGMKEAAGDVVKAHGDLAAEVEAFRKEASALREEVKAVVATQSSLSEELSSKASQRSLSDLVTKVEANFKSVEERMSSAASEAEEALQKLKKSLEDEIAQIRKEETDLAMTLQSTAASDKEWKQSFEQTTETLHRAIHTVREDLRVPPGGCLQRDFADTPPVLEVMVNCGSTFSDEADVVIEAASSDAS